jgi:hypothetical protein
MGFLDRRNAHLKCRRFTYATFLKKHVNSFMAKKKVEVGIYEMNYDRFFTVVNSSMIEPQDHDAISYSGSQHVAANIYGTH